MSLILKGVDMPICSNEECVVVIKKNKAEVLQTGYKKRIVEVIQISKPHGRIIDAGKVYCYNYWEEQNLDEAPTILEAEV